MQITTFPIELLESSMISPKVKHFVFQARLSPAFKYLPGQFITIHFTHEGKALKRSYSIANEPKDNNIIEFAASYFKGGPGTELLFGLQPGNTIDITGPFGRLTLKEDNAIGRYIFAATSTGITPFRSMLSELSKRLQQNPHLKIVILLGVQKKPEILYGNEFRAFVQQFPLQTEFYACLSRENRDNLSHDEVPGYVQAHFPELNLNPAHDIVYLCGNPGMIDGAFNYLKDQGFAVPQIIREKYISR